MNISAKIIQTERGRERQRQKRVIRGEESEKITKL